MLLTKRDNARPEGAPLMAIEDVLCENCQRVARGHHPPLFSRSTAAALAFPPRGMGRGCGSIGLKDHLPRSACGDHQAGELLASGTAWTSRSLEAVPRPTVLRRPHGTVEQSWTLKVECARMAEVVLPRSPQ